MPQNNLGHSRETFESWGRVNYHLLQRVRPYIAGRVLDAGCARGGYTAALLNRECNIYGCDLFFWPEWSRIVGDHFYQADLTGLPFVDHSFDTVLSFSVLEHVQSIQRALQELRRVCRGRLILAVPNCQLFSEMGWAGLTFHHWTDQSHVHFFQRGTLRTALVEAGFEIEFLEPFGTIRPEILLLTSLGVPMLVARGMARLLQMVPWRRRYAPLLLAVTKARN